MTLMPGESTTVSMQFMMHEGMDGKHNFRLHPTNNDPNQPAKTLTILSNWVP
jgi:hypothetical protein